ncbi:MAG: hypothetical protein HYT39_00685 [Candidatus Sungbacteria bacterium]|nr:hypothetical protein [Candidatus Sungbacteria bacterium]
MLHLRIVAVLCFAVMCSATDLRAGQFSLERLWGAERYDMRVVIDPKPPRERGITEHLLLFVRRLSDPAEALVWELEVTPLSAVSNMVACDPPPAAARVYFYQFTQDGLVIRSWTRVLDCELFADPLRLLWTDEEALGAVRSFLDLRI